eukprot:m.100289 g.100289  ORF g.100289 m.100289 type:complete len:391 (-) comp8925_c0_seq2:929-2101(-)
MDESFEIVPDHSDGFIQHDMSGFLVKRGFHNTRSWKQRWFEAGSDGCVVYYANDSKRKEIGRIPLLDATVREAHVAGRDFCFEIVTQKRIWVLMAANRLQMEAWIRWLSGDWNTSQANQLITRAENEILEASAFREPSYAELGPFSGARKGVVGQALLALDSTAGAAWDEMLEAPEPLAASLVAPLASDRVSLQLGMEASSDGGWSETESVFSERDDLFGGVASHVSSPTPSLLSRTSQDSWPATPSSLRSGSTTSMGLMSTVVMDNPFPYPSMLSCAIFSAVVPHLTGSPSHPEGSQTMYHRVVRYLLVPGDYCLAKYDSAVSSFSDLDEELSEEIRARAKRRNYSVPAKLAHRLPLPRNAAAQQMSGSPGSGGIPRPPTRFSFSPGAN